MALDLIKQQEITKAAEHHKQEAEYAAYVKQMEVGIVHHVCVCVRASVFVCIVPPLSLIHISEPTRPY